MWKRDSFLPKDRKRPKKQHRKESRLLPSRESGIGRTGTSSFPLDDFGKVLLTNRYIFIVFDSDAVSNPQVRKAEHFLAEFLRHQGAYVAVKRIPPGPNGEKVGLDDYLLTHTKAEFWALPSEPAAAPPTTGRRGNLITTVEGNPKPLLANAITVLREEAEWLGVLAFNEFSLYPVTRKATLWGKPAGENWTDTDDIRTSEWLQH